jgi:hypothetical protein
MNGGLKGCEEKGMMMMVITMKLRSWHIMKAQGKWRGEEVTTSWRSKLFKGNQINSHHGKWKQDHQIRALAVVQGGELCEHGDQRWMGKGQGLIQEERSRKEERARNVGCEP